MKAETDRFVLAQEGTFEAAMAELKAGRKRGHWMWFIFPQLRGLGFSETSRFYGIQGLAEAAEYLNHPLLGSRLRQICSILLELESDDAHSIFGSPDDLKLRSCLSLFSMVPDTSPVFQELLNKYFNGKSDPKTLQLLEGSSA